MAGHAAGPAIGGIEDLKRGPNAEFGAKDYFEITSNFLRYGGRSEWLQLTLLSL